MEQSCAEHVECWVGALAGGTQAKPSPKRRKRITSMAAFQNYPVRGALLVLWQESPALEG